MSASNLHTIWAQLFLSSLRRAGVVDVVVSPGSRSTPLALAASMDPGLRIHVILDERAAAFFALGQARQSLRPSVLVCTSGTAPAHYLPAVIEAAQSHIPLLIVSADRPWEDYDCAAAQTVDQVKLFGDYVRHYAELGLPDRSLGALRAVVRIAVQSVAVCLSPLPGPVHINARFRKPLEPVDGAEPEIPSSLLSQLQDSLATTAYPSQVIPSESAKTLLRSLCETRRRGIVVCGPAHCGTDAAALRAAVRRLSVQTGYPIWAESTSGVRFGGGIEVCGGFDAFLRDPQTAKWAPELLIELGGPPVSSAYAGFASKQTDCVRVVIAPFGWNDPIGTAQHICADPVALLQSVSDVLPPLPIDEAWLRAFSDAEQRTRRAVEDELSDPVLCEGAVSHMLCRTLPAESVLLVGNSLPVRDLDLFCPPSDKPLRVLHQRGASGIDGLHATVAGVRSQTAQPVALLLGDLSAQHDLGGLAALGEARGPLIVVIVQNGGGRIFEQLPVGANTVAAPHFSKLFLTPQTIDFSAAAAAFGIPFVRVSSTDSYQAALAQGLTSDRPLIIEAVVPGDDGRTRRKRIWSQSTRKIQTASSSDPFVFLHGFLGSPEQWKDLADAHGLPLHADFLPGHGPTPWTLPDADFFAVVDALAERFPMPRVALCGYSLGARLALALAIRHPERVSSLLLVGVDPGIIDDADRRARSAWEDELARRLIEQGLPSFVKEWEKLPLFASQARLSEQAQLRQRCQRLSHDPRALAWVLRTLGTGRMPSLWPSLISLKVPVRLVTGAHDEKFTAIAQKMCAQNPLFQHLVVPQAGHNPIVEAAPQMLSIFSNHRTHCYGDNPR